MFWAERRGGSNEYPQSMFWAEIWKISEFLSESFQFLQVKCSIYLNDDVRLSLLTMTNPNQLFDVLLFVCSKMADETNLFSKLPVADRTREVWGRKLCWWCLSSGFPLCTFLLGFASFCFVFTSSPSYEASPLLFDPVQSVPMTLLVCWSL